VEEGNWTSSTLHSKQLLCSLSLFSSNVNQNLQAIKLQFPNLFFCDYASIENSVLTYFRHKSLVIKISLAGSTDHYTVNNHTVLIFVGLDVYDKSDTPGLIFLLQHNNSSGQEARRPPHTKSASSSNGA
jgi:hypothetical protein